jgi:hypothetical protein
MKPTGNSALSDPNVRVFLRNHPEAYKQFGLVEAPTHPVLPTVPSHNIDLSKRTNNGKKGGRKTQKRRTNKHHAK